MERHVMTGGLAVHQEETPSRSGLDQRGLKPPHCPNPDSLLPAQPAPRSSAGPAHHQYQHPSSTLSHSHTVSFLSPAVCQSLSPPPLPQSGHSSSLFSCPLYIPPPLSFFLQLDRLVCVRGLRCRALCPKGSPKGCDWRRKLFTTMNVQLLLLLALAGPFCAFTHAKRGSIFKRVIWMREEQETRRESTRYVMSLKRRPTLFHPHVISSSSTPPLGIYPSLLDESLDPGGQSPTEIPSDLEVADVTEAPKEELSVVEAVTEELPAVEVNTEEAVVETEAAATEAPEAPEVIVTDPPAAAEEEVVPTEAVLAEEDVVVEDGTAEGMSSGQVVGIVIGALIAVIIAIAVVIAVVRRMGKYSESSLLASSKYGAKEPA
ncbi:Podoplanin [Dissostichus eleginoides]|uniref:Podoplanin n=1 Tax=Dissostichus eleginoides TaxID=100907 RepID=A0AAD9FEH1_DISEL|nr:Podoplanin [Dissostichus eleginoides]